MHHNNAHHTSDEDKSCASVDTPVPSESTASVSSSEGQNHKDENYQLHVDKKLKAGSHVHCRQHRGNSQSSQKGKKGDASPTFMDDDLDFTDAILMGLNSMDADLKKTDDITNLFDFNM